MKLLLFFYLNDIVAFWLLINQEEKLVHLNAKTKEEMGSF